MNKIVIINDYEGDYSSLFVNGELVYDNHSIEVRDLVRYTPIESITEINVEDYPGMCDYLMEFCTFGGMTLDQVLAL